ncbi:uncharacterized protein LOC123498075 [Portunus trituberculatus]|uniref:uncharacterized protein LOC123498075 n=1 Tax=Portunus trituberculatus TaxID=210409 RepID=UPI001E1CBF93|nr:uncharacterized protein LOC123498075 [Portunus trituberculatus]XP_045101111.1 uncharacterized protein LOC123498075 [Portunus trituberculatus]
MEAYKGIRTHMRRINYDLVVLRNRLVELKKRANLLCSEALQHQLNFMLDSVDQRILGHNPLLDIGFGERYLDLMNKKSEVQQKVSLSGLSEVKVSVKRVVGLLDEPEPLSSPKRRKVENDTSEDIQIEKGVFKLYKTDGTIGDVAYATTFLVKNKLGDEGEKIEEMTDLSLGTQSTVVKRMLTPERLSSHETVYCFTADLYYYKMLHDKRGEALDHLESEMPGVEVVRGTEPVVLQLLSHGQHQVEVQWDLIWHDLNSRFKYKISVECSEEVVTRYSTADVYPYLSKRKKLQTVEDVTSFAEAFLNL